MFCVLFIGNFVLKEKEKKGEEKERERSVIMSGKYRTMWDEIVDNVYNCSFFYCFFGVNEFCYICNSYWYFVYDCSVILYYFKFLGR